MVKGQTSGIASPKPGRAEALNVFTGIALAVLMTANAASAADMSGRFPPTLPALAPLPFTWTGFYLGANLGGGWASGTLSDSFTGARLGDSSSGVVGGGQLGYNYQMGSFVLGGEWTFDGTSLNASRTVGGLQGTANTHWITTVAARFGFADNNWLYYGKAGGGWADNSATLTSLINGTQVSSSNTNGGWLLGAGIEWAFAPQWSAKLEYNYLGLNSWTVNSTLFVPNADRFSVSRNIQTLMVGVNYRF
jgi:outer membrane immunogenic protein